jgi:hypothetical protein
MALALAPAPGPLPTFLPTPLHIAELDRLGDEIARLAAHLDAASARLLDLIREFDRRGGWNTGFRSCAAWLTWRVGLAPGAAREKVRVARALGALPRLAQALARGELSYSKVRALTRIATPETEERLLRLGRAGTAAHVERVVRGWRWVDRQAEAREAALRHAHRGLRLYTDADGMVVVRGRLPPEVGALLQRALEAARERLYPPIRRPAPPPPERSRGDVSAETPEGRSRGNALPPADLGPERPTFPQQRADALALLAESALHADLDPGAPGERYQVVVHVEASALADPAAPGQSVLEGGERVPAETSRRLACDASRVLMRHDADGRVVEIGARTRTIPPALRRALLARDPGCRFPGCDRPGAHGHHVRHWASGGPTTLGNLVLLCRFHHRAVHEEGYRVARGPDGGFSFQRPSGEPLPEVPPLPPVPADPVRALQEQNEAEGVQIHPRTACPAWLGEPLDVGWALDVLHPLALAARPGWGPASTGPPGQPLGSAMRRTAKRWRR